MLSAQGRIDVAVDALRFGAYDYFSKPIDQQKLELASRMQSEIMIWLKNSKT